MTVHEATDRHTIRQARTLLRWVEALREDPPEERPQILDELRDRL